MFNNLCSFDGRIRRTEYALTYIFYWIGVSILSFLINLGGIATFSFFMYFPLVYLLFAQGAKRCHDRGNTGWFQLIPFYVFWMIFANGDSGENEYGLNPKEIESPKY